MKVILASNNKNKLKEIRDILAPFDIQIVSQSEAGINLEVEETGSTFEENALLKAEAIYKITKTPVIADDSGIEVDYLNKAPGVYSARYGGETFTDVDRCYKIIDELRDVPMEKRTARFVCVMQYIDGYGNVYTSRGECEGYIGYELIGENGFGYDPIFMDGDRSFAQRSAEEKNSISHRARALNKVTQIFK